MKKIVKTTRTTRMGKMTKTIKTGRKTSEVDEVDGPSDACAGESVNCNVGDGDVDMKCAYWTWRLIVSTIVNGVNGYVFSVTSGAMTNKGMSLTRIFVSRCGYPTRDLLFVDVATGSIYSNRTKTNQIGSTTDESAHTQRMVKILLAKIKW
jgi:hypothetical protein